MTQPFGSYATNPSWLAVKPLHGLTLHTPQGPVELHALQLPVKYSAVLDTLSRVHAARTAGAGDPYPVPHPALQNIAAPYFDPDWVEQGWGGKGEAYPHGFVSRPPRGGWDAVLHCGVGGSLGQVKIETLARSHHYGKKDCTHLLAPRVDADGRRTRAQEPEGRQVGAAEQSGDHPSWWKWTEEVPRWADAAGQAQKQRVPNAHQYVDGEKGRNGQQANVGWGAWTAWMVWVALCRVSQWVWTLAVGAVRGFPRAAYPRSTYPDVLVPQQAGLDPQRVLDALLSGLCVDHKDATTPDAISLATEPAATAGPKLDVRLSSNAGRYVCEYVLYTSLAEARRAALAVGRAPVPVLFVHCPPLAAGRPSSTAQVSAILQHVAAYMACVGG